jgi:hypothetical protein
MTPYKRRDLIIVAVCIVSLFLWVQIIGLESGSDDDFVSPLFLSDHKIFGSKKSKPLSGLADIRKSQLVQNPLVQASTTVPKDSQTPVKNDPLGVQGPDNRPNSTLGVRILCFMNFF